MLIELLYYALAVLHIFGFIPLWLIFILVVADIAYTYFEYKHNKNKPEGYLVKVLIITVVMLNVIDLIPMWFDFWMLVILMGWRYGMMQHRKGWLD